MGHSSYTFDAAHGRTFHADCWTSANEEITYVQLRTAGSFAQLLLSNRQLEQLHAVLQQRVTQIVARRMNEAQAAGKGCVCPEYAGESASCPVHGGRVS